MKSKILGLLAAGLLAGPVAANAGYILDTGTPTGGDYSIGFYNVDCCFQHLGVTFNVASASSITSVEAWILPVASGDVSFELRAGNSPTGDLIFSTTVTIDGAAAEGWYGATNLDWDVAAGDYTLTLIALYGFDGAMGIAPPSRPGMSGLTTEASGSLWGPIILVGALARNPPASPNPARSRCSASASPVSA